MRGAMSDLAALAARTELEFLNDRVAVAAAKYQLIVATEAALDLCNHLCARTLRKAPGTYADCFALLAEGGVIRADTAQRLMPMARFRNLLVHQYGQIENARVYRIIREDLADLEQFLGEVAQYLGQQI